MFAFGLFFYNHVKSPKINIPESVGIDHFTVVCLVTWPLNESEPEVDLVLVETFQLF